MQAPAITGILETALYVDDLNVSASFYERVFGFSKLFLDHRLCAMNAGPARVLLLFKKGASNQPTKTPGGIVPPSDGRGQLHLAFSIEAKALDHWKDWLQQCGIELESTVHWPAGGTSIYFRDPDGHALELATPGLWENY
jgi:catechol 2,3-dioxygenase-like lactoylglutathione lyase family enzyme